MLIIASHTHWSLTELKAMTPDELSYWAEGLAEIQREADARRERSRGWQYGWEQWYGFHTFVDTSGWQAETSP